jgi:hypothetical protein
MQQKASWESNSTSTSQEIPRILWDPIGSLPHSQEPVPPKEQSDS